MPSTYTVNLGIEKPATGEQSGTWGDTVNDNSNILDEAINGAVTITLSSAGSSGSPNSITITNGASSTGRNKWIEFDDGGDLGAAAYVQLTPNDAEKICNIRNSLSGSRSIFIFQGTYSTSNDLEIAAGTDVVVKFNGGGTGATVVNVYANLKVDGIVATTADINGGTVDGTVIGGASAAALTATTVVANTSVNIAGDGATVTGIKDEDNMASNSATKLATQQSIKAYVDSQVGTVDTLAEILANGNTTGSTDIDVAAAQKIQFRDAAIYINSSVDGQLDIVADTEIQIAATTIDINGAIVASGDISAASLDISGNVDIDGVLNVDAIDIDGAVQLDATLTVGVDDTGYDVKFYGATGGAYMLWDESADDLILAGAAGLSVAGASTLTGVLTTTAATVFNGGFASNAASTISLADNGTQLTLISTDADAAVGPVLDLFRNSASPSNFDLLGKLVFSGEDDGGNKTDYVHQIAYPQTTTGGSEQGYWELHTLVGGTDRVRLEASATEVAVNNPGIDSDFRVESDGNANMLFVDGGANAVGIGTVPARKLHVMQDSDGNGIRLSHSGRATSTYWDQELSGVNNEAIVFRQYDGSSEVTAYAMSRTNHQFNVSGTERFAVSANTGIVATPAANGHAVFNEAGVDADFRVESDTNTHALFVQGSDGFVGVGDSSPSYPLEVANAASTSIAYQRTGVSAKQWGFTSDNSGTIWSNITDGVSPLILSNAGVASFINNLTLGANTTFPATGILHHTNGFLYVEGGSNGIILRSASGGAQMMKIQPSEVNVNDDSVDMDFRVESDGNAHAFYLNGANGYIGMGAGASPTQPLSVGARTGANLNYINGTDYSVSTASGILISATTTNEATAGFGLLLANNANNDNARSPVIGFSALSASNGYNHLYAAINARKRGNGADTNWNHGDLEFSTSSGTGPNVRMVLDHLGGLVLNPTTGGHAVFNEDSADADFRVESDNLAHALFVQGSDGKIGLGASATGARCTVAETSASTLGLYVINSAATVVNSSSSLLYLQATGDSAIQDGYKMVTFADSDTVLGSISTASNSSNVTYNTSSDERLKENIVDARSQLDTLLAVKVREYDWKKNGFHSTGFIAQELHEHFPEAVTVGLEDENKHPWSVDYGRLTPFIIKAMQEQQSLIEKLTARITALEG